MIYYTKDLETYDWTFTNLHEMKSLIKKHEAVNPIQAFLLTNHETDYFESKIFKMTHSDFYGPYISSERVQYCIIRVGGMTDILPIYFPRLLKTKCEKDYSIPKRKAEGVYSGHIRTGFNDMRKKQLTTDRELGFI